jgi:multidrug resistance efflux pump
MREPYSISAEGILDTWSNDPWTNGVQTIPVKIVLDFNEDEDELFRVGISVHPKVWAR